MISELVDKYPALLLVAKENIEFSIKTVVPIEYYNIDKFQQESLINIDKILNFCNLNPVPKEDSDSN